MRRSRQKRCSIFCHCEAGRRRIDLRLRKQRTGHTQAVLIRPKRFVVNLEFRRRHEAIARASVNVR